MPCADIMAVCKMAKLRQQHIATEYDHKTTCQPVAYMQKYFAQFRTIKMHLNCCN